MTPKIQIIASKSSRGLKRARATVHRLSRTGVSAPEWMRTSLWIFPILGAAAWFLLRVSDWMTAFALTGTMAAPMMTGLCFKTVEMKRLISQALPFLLVLCGLSIAQSFLVTSIVESLRETGIIVPGLSRVGKGSRH